MRLQGGLANTLGKSLEERAQEAWEREQAAVSEFLSDRES
jgi:hypothetical protein